jgi:hypothetical protein
MTEGQLKQMLYAYPRITEAVATLNVELSELARMKGTTAYIASARLDGMPRSRNTGEPLLDHIIHVNERYNRQVRRKVAEINRLLSMKETVETVMHELWREDTTDKKREYKLICMRYFERASWVHISMELNYDEKWVICVGKRLFAKMLNWCNNRKIV